MAKSIAIIVTTRNEKNSIKSLLDSIVFQTIKPDEVIFLDADSKDETREIISSYKSKISGLKLIKSKLINRSKGRNKAIKEAKSNIIAVTDAGCTLKQDWLAKITHPILSGEAQAVAGFYLTSDSNLLEKSSAPFLAVMPDSIDPETFLPSSRSVAFTKKAWKEAGKYPENVSFCEDLTFAQNLKLKTNLVVQPRALVYWNHYQGIKKFFYQIRNYARGDVEAGYAPHLYKIITVYARYLLFAVINPLFFVYLFWPIRKHYKYVKSPLAIFTLPMFQVLTDAGIILGSLIGLVKRVGI
jgi:glycosyltransferase involved in cell wall biosynthesis